MWTAYTDSDYYQSVRFKRVVGGWTREISGQGSYYPPNPLSAYSLAGWRAWCPTQQLLW